MTQQSTALNYEDIALLAILDALEADLGTTGARNKLGVAHRTFANCRDSRRLTPRMRRLLKQGVDWGPVVDNPVANIPLAEADQSYSSTEDPDQTLARKVTALEAENRELREATETQTAHIADWGRRLAALGKQPHKGGGRGWLAWIRPIKREEVVTDRFMDPPMPGVVTFEHRLGEEQALGRAAPVVAEWRDVKWTESTSEEQVEQAEARVRRLELEGVLIEEFRLTLPPYTEPGDFEARSEASYRRRHDMVLARGELEKARQRQSRGGD